MIFEVECDERTYELTDRTHTRIVSFIVLDGLLSTLLLKYRVQSTLHRHLHINDHSSPAFAIGNTFKMKQLVLVITISICQLCYGSSAPINLLTPPPWPVVRPPWRPGFIPRSFRVSQLVDNFYFVFKTHLLKRMIMEK